MRRFDRYAAKPLDIRRHGTQKRFPFFPDDTEIGPNESADSGSNGEAPGRATAHERLHCYRNNS
jgi:hypothetical protein